MLNKTIHTRYKIIQPLGSGAFGQTYLATDLALPNEGVCVVKQLKPQSSDPASFKMAKLLFDREAETLKRIGSYERIPQILDYFEEDQEFYLVQDYIEGKTLREEFNSQTVWNEHQAVSFLKEILQILEFIHGQAIIHRDIKPENIIRRVQDQKLFLIDFGAVKQLWLDREQSPSTIIHSRGYTPPEQLAGIPEPNSDIYALGMTCIEALAGVKPEALTQLRDTRTQSVIWAESSNLSSKFKSILNTMVCIDVRKRYESAHCVLQDLELLEQVSSTHYTPTEVSLSYKDSLALSGNSQAYIPTELGTDQAIDADLDIEELKPQLETDPVKTSKSQKKLSSSELLLELSECLTDRQKSLQLKQVVTISRQLLQKKPLILSGFVMTILIVLSFLSLTIYKFSSSRSNSSLVLDPLNTKATHVEPTAVTQAVGNFKNDTSSIKSLKFTPDGKTLISISEEGLVKLRDVQNQSVTLLTQTPHQILAASTSIDSKALAIATEGKLIEVWNLKNHQKLKQISTQQLIWSLALSQDSQLLAAGGLGVIKLWNIQSQPKLLSQQSDETAQPIQAIVFNSTAEVLAMGNADGTVKISNRALNIVHTFHKHSKAVSGVAIDADGALLLTGSEDDTIRIWNLYALNEHTLPAIQADLGGVTAIASSPTKKLIAGSGVYGTVKLWNWHTGQLVTSFTNHAAAVTAMAFSPDGQMLAIGDREGRIVIYILK